MTDQSSKAIFLEIVSKYLGPFLLKQGFESDGTTSFIRRDGDRVLRVILDLIRCKGIDAGFLTVTVSVGFSSLTKLVKDCSVPVLGKPNRPALLVTNIGGLLPSKQYKQWGIQSGVKEEDIAFDVMEIIKEYGFLLFERFSSLESAIQAIESGESYNIGATRDIYLACAYWLCGKQEAALVRLEEASVSYERKYSRTRHPRDEELMLQYKKCLEFLKKGKV